MREAIAEIKKLSSLVALAALLFPSSALGLETQRQVLHGHVPGSAEKLLFRYDLSKSARLNLAIGLPIRNLSALTNLLAELYDPQSPTFHQYLTPADFSLNFGSRQEDFDALLLFARTNNFIVTLRHRNRLLLDVNASVEDIEKAFHIRMGVYQHPTESRTFYAPDVEPSLDLSIPLLFIGGLNDFVLPRPMNRNSLSSVSPNNGSAADGTYVGKDFRNAYVPGVSLNGAGQTVALVQFDGFYTNDILAYEALAGLPDVPLQTSLMDGYDGIPSTSSGNIEVSLDIETVISMAPGLSRIILYEAGPAGIPEDVLSQIANDNVARQISSSWTWAPYDPNSEAIFLQFAAQGQTFFNATGDRDAFVGPITQAPCDDPYVTQVGGTALIMNGAGDAYLSESVWNRGNGVGSSGGVSTSFVIPPWQSIVDMSSNQGSASMRNVPDVVMVAEGVHVRYGNGSSGAFGGTSCAAPLWAAFTALMNQQATAAGKPGVGFLNPALYQIGTNAIYHSCFHDVTNGDNTWSNSPTLFRAVPGYDLCTGWGSPNGSNLIDAVVGPPTMTPRIIPDGFTLLMETCPNGFIDPGETVTLNIGLRNVGLTSTSDLVATLNSDAGVVFPSSPQNYGTLLPGGVAVAMPFTFVVTGACGVTNSLVLHLQDGATNLGAVSFPLPLGFRNDLPSLAQHFDVTGAPDLPAGWTVQASGAGPTWASSDSAFHSAPNSAYVRDANAPSDHRLVSPSFLIASSSAQLAFSHNYYTETSFDGGVLEISINGAPFTDILAVGGSFAANGYSKTISTCCGNPLGGRAAWSGSSGGVFVTTLVNLPPAAAGHAVQLRWRFCSDASVGAAGWYLDDILVNDGFACCTAIRPYIRSIAAFSNEVAITWNSISNASYRLQYTTNFPATNWVDLPGDITAQSLSATKTDEMQSVLRKFYRVILLP